jgi:hypothetical protein
MSNKLTPYFEVNGKRYELMTTRHLRIMYADELEKMKSENKLDEEEAINLVDFNRFTENFNQVSEKFRNANDDYLSNPLDKDKKAIFYELKELYNEMLSEMKSKKDEMKILNESIANSVNLYERMIIEALKEQYSLSQKEAENVWADFVVEIGKQEAQNLVVSIGQEMFESEVQENSFLEQRKLKLQQQAENRKKETLK